MTKTGTPKTYFFPQETNALSNTRASQVNMDLIKMIDDVDYPCLGAKSAFNTEQYRLGIYGEMGTKSTTEALGKDLRAYIKETLATQSKYMSMIAVFGDEINSEIGFEQRLWTQLQQLHDIEKETQQWDPSVSSDPDDNNFSFSFGGQAFFVVGLHPYSSRKSRRLPYAAMAFNLHRQFEQLRESDLYEKMKSVIRERDIAFDGSINPMLTDHGEGREAPQYSGRMVDKNWKCPFHAG